MAPKRRLPSKARVVRTSCIALRKAAGMTARECCGFRDTFALTLGPAKPSAWSHRRRTGKSYLPFRLTWHLMRSGTRRHWLSAGCVSGCADRLWRNWFWRPINSSHGHMPPRCGRPQPPGDEIRAVIAGYHWFTDWGRDTMHSLEGLRYDRPVCRSRLLARTFALYVRDGLSPTLSPRATSTDSTTPPMPPCGTFTPWTAT